MVKKEEDVDKSIAIRKAINKTQVDIVAFGARTIVMLEITCQIQISQINITCLITDKVTVIGALDVMGTIIMYVIVPMLTNSVENVIVLVTSKDCAVSVTITIPPLHLE